MAYIVVRQDHDPPRLCALDLPGEHAEGDDLGEHDSHYFSERADELEARPSRSHASCRVGAWCICLRKAGCARRPWRSPWGITPLCKVPAGMHGCCALLPWLLNWLTCVRVLLAVQMQQ